MTIAAVLSGVTTLRDRIDGMFSVTSDGYITFTYQMLSSTNYGTIARFKGTIQAMSGSYTGSYTGAMYDIDFVAINDAAGTPTALGTLLPSVSSGSFPTSVSPDLSGTISGSAPSLTVTSESGTIIRFTIDNAHINSAVTYWHLAIDVTLMESKN